MAAEQTKELQAGEKRAAAPATEQTRSGPVFTPAVDIFETETALTVVADIPGVKAQDLTIDLRENLLTLIGDVAPLEGPEEGDVLREYPMGSYVRQFTLAETIDQAQIKAQLSDGVLRLTLPKVERAKPRQITVQAG
jgi:HSP20 family molecular chaperone IbpA